MIKVEKVVTGYLDENCYIIHDGISGLVVDPGDDIEKIINKINEFNLVIKGILITHYHFDHIGALEDMKKMYPNAKVVDYKDSGNVTLDNFSFKVIETFGHTMDSCSYYFEEDKMLFSGDFIFKGTIGNYEEDHHEDMIKSFQVLKYISPITTIYPGHDDETTVEIELKTNPFLKGI